MTTMELNRILEKHVKWLNNKLGGVRADLRDADLRDVDLSNADLSDADLMGANLRGANLLNATLRKADLICANLSGANLRGAYLSGADLSGAILRDANLLNATLRNADLGSADLMYADLSGTNLMRANLSGAILRDANLRGADLRDTILRDANLSGANLSGAIGISMACPSDGSFIGWKMVSNKLIKLLIPEDAKRSSATSNKCRCDKAYVLGIYNLDSSVSEVSEILNTKYEPVLYQVNKYVYPDYFDENRWNECSHGIHFFIDKQEAISYAIN